MTWRDARGAVPIFSISRQAPRDDPPRQGAFGLQMDIMLALERRGTAEAKDGDPGLAACRQLDRRAAMRTKMSGSSVPRRPVWA